MRFHNVSNVPSDDRTDSCIDSNQELLTSSAVQIQRAWRNYLRNKGSCSVETRSNSQPMQLSTSPQTSDCPNDFGASHTVQSHHHSAAGSSTSSSTQSGGHLHPATARHLIEPDPNSISSDYSEMAEPIREHLANVQIICREDLAMGNTVGPGAGLPLPSVGAGVPLGLERDPEETDEAYCRRVRVTNYLSLAQEFAALKKVDSRVLPFDLHRGGGGELSNKTGCSTSSDEAELEDSEEDDVDEACTQKTTSTASQPPQHSIVPSDRGRDSSLASSKLALKTCVPVPDVVPNLSRSRNQPGSNPSSGERCSEAVKGGTPSMSSVSRQQPVKCSAHHGAKMASAEANNVGSEPSGVEEFDLYTIETAMPHVEWERLEQQLNKAEEEEKKRRSVYGGDRDEIRRRLAMSAFDDDEATWPSGASRSRHGHQASNAAPGTQNRLLHSTTSLQVCYLNDSLDADQDMDAMPHSRSSSKPDIIPKSISEASTLSQYNRAPALNSGKDSNIHEDFFTKQARLKAEAKLALAQVRPMAHMQLQVEKQSRKKSPLSDIVVGIPGFVDGKMRHMSRQLLLRMNIAQLQVVVNDLHAQIEALNADLMQQLVDRDDLHMAQDSMLVDIDDLTRRAQEYAAKVNKQAAAAETGK